MAKEQFDVYAEVTDSIIRAMEAGTPPWRKPWTGDQAGAAFPLRSTGERYQGINVLMLWLAAFSKGYRSAHWFTFKQAQAMGAGVRKGEKSSTVVKYGTVDKKDEETGLPVKIPYARAYRVFNADQIDGLPAEYYAAPAEPIRDLGTEADPTLDAFFTATGADIRTSTTPQAYYNSTDDFIHMPPVGTFHNAQGYYSTLAHESAHWTGHTSRLDRFQKGRTRTAYAYEELVAEIGACMICAHLGVAPEFDQSAAYIEGWLRALKDDKRLIFTAASDAHKALNFLIDGTATGRAADGEDEEAPAKAA